MALLPIGLGVEQALTMPDCLEAVS